MATRYKQVAPSEIKVGDRIRFTADFLNWYEAYIVGPGYTDGMTEFQKVTAIQVAENCPEEYYSFYFSKTPGDCYIYGLNCGSGIEKPFDVEVN